MFFNPSLDPAERGTTKLERHAWDEVYLDGKRVPELGKVEGGALKLKVDPKGKGGSNKHKPTSLGLDPQEFRIEAVQWTDAQRDEVSDLVRDLIPKMGKVIAVQAVELADLGITAAMLTGIGQQVRDGTKTKRVFTLRHWIAPAADTAANKPKPKNTPAKVEGYTNRITQGTALQRPTQTKQGWRGLGVSQ